MDLSVEVEIHVSTLSRWIRKGWLQGRRATPKSKWWIAWADAEECARLRLLASREEWSPTLPLHYNAALGFE